MLLKRIKFCNFRPFIGEQEVLLTNPENDNASVTVILGDNTYGKTTFVLAFIWCLYGESRFNRADSILNKKIESKLGLDSLETASVEIEFEDAKKNYTIIRSQEFRKSDKGKLKASKSIAKLTYVDEDGIPRKISGLERQSEIELIIKSILPLDLSSFFFFEGEKNNEINNKDLSQSVKTLLGLEAYDRMRIHLHGASSSSIASTKSVMGNYRKRQNDESNTKAKEEYEKREQAEKTVNYLTTRIAEIDKQIDNYESLRDETNEKLRKAEPSKAIQARRDQISKELADCENDLGIKNKEIIKTFSKESVPLFVTPLLEKAREKLAKMEVTNKGIVGIEGKAIRELLARKECLCGCDLIEGTSAYKNVLRYIDYIPPKDVGTLVREMLENIDEATEKNKDFVDEFESRYKDVSKLRLKINDLEKEDRGLLAKIKEIGAFNTEDLESLLINCKNSLNALRDEKDDLKSQRTTAENEKKTAENNFNMYKSKSQRALQLNLYYQYAEAIYEWVNKNYTAKENELKNRLDKYISEMFNNMYSGKREMHIDDKYNIVMTVNGSFVADTGGLRAIQYFSYVGGLVKLAYEIMKEREKDVVDKEEKPLLGEEYPLVLDAAFSHTDETHTKNIAKVLANSVNQLVLALMKKDWAFAQKGMIGKVGRIYELKKIDETEAHFEEV